VRQLVFLLFIAAVLIGGGLLMNTLNEQTATSSPGFGIKTQTNNPEADISAVTPNKAAVFFLFAGAVLGLLGGTATFFALIMWLLNRQALVATKTPNQGFSFSLDPSQKNSVGAVLATNPAVTIGVVVIVIVTLAVGAALATGAFTPR
jgi:hypothetical protein